MVLLQWLGFVTTKQIPISSKTVRYLDIYLFLWDCDYLRLMCCWFCSGLSGICYGGSFGSCFSHPNLSLAHVMQKSFS